MLQQNIVLLILHKRLSMSGFIKDKQYIKFCAYGFLKNLKIFEPVFILFLLSKGLTFWQIGVIYSAREIIRNIFEIPSGLISDAMGRRKTLIFSFVFYIISFVVFYLSQNYIVLLVAISIFAFGDAFRTGTHKAMIYDYLSIKNWQDQKVIYYGYTRSWSQNGSAINAILAAGIIFITGNYDVIFLLASIPYIADIILIWSYPKELEGPIKKLHTKEILKAFRKTFTDIAKVLKQSSSWVSIIRVSSHSGYYRATKEYIQPVIVGFALSAYCLGNFNGDQRKAIGIGVIYFIIYLLSGIASKNAGKFAKHLRNPQKALFVTLLLGFSAGAIAGIFMQNNILIISLLAFLIIYLIENLRKPIGLAAIADKSENSVMASVLSIQSQVSSIIAAIIAPILGLLSDILGIGYALSIISFVLLLLLLATQIGSRN